MEKLFNLKTSPEQASLNCSGSDTAGLNLFNGIISEIKTVVTLTQHDSAERS